MSLTLRCLLIKGEEPIGEPFLASADPSLPVGLFVQKVLTEQQLKTIPDRIKLWKFRDGLLISSTLENSSLQEVSARLNCEAKHLLDPGTRMESYSTIKEVQGQIHALVELPLDDDKPGYPDDFRLEGYITFKIPSIDTFQDADHSLLGLNYISQHQGTEPAFLTDLREELRQKRFIKLDMVQSLEQAFQGVSQFFEVRNEAEERRDPRHVSPAEYQHYLFAMTCDTLVNINAYKDSRRAQIYALIYQLKEQVTAARGKLLCDAKWRFYLVIDLEKSGVGKRKYLPQNDADIRFQDFSDIIINVCSDPRIETDRFHLLLQASCLARFGNRIRKADAGHEPIIISAIYVDVDMQVSWYHVFEEHDGHVKYTVDILDISSLEGLLRFLVWLYNAVAPAALASKRLTYSLAPISGAQHQVEDKGYQYIMPSTSRDALGEVGKTDL